MKHLMMRLLYVYTLLVVLQLTWAGEGYFWHITDQHWDTTYWTEQRSCNDDVPKPGIYGDYWCDSNWRLVNDSINAMVNLKSDVDFILWTGDNVAHISNEHMNLSLSVDITAQITSTLKAAFPGVRVFATLGNHDWFPSDQFTPHSADIYNETAEIWRDWIQDEAQLNNFRAGGFYTQEIAPGLRMVSVNTILYYTADKQTQGLTDPAGQFAWLDTVLHTARQTGEKVYLIGHVPPGVKIPGQVWWFYDSFNTHFVQLVSNYSDVITAMYFGHDHADEFKLFMSGSGDLAGIPMFMAPSVTPWRYKTPLESAPPHNPGVRLFRYDTNTSLPLDYTQFFMDLDASNKVNQSTWMKAYSAVDAYNVTDLSGSSVNKLVKKMAVDSKYVDNYIRFNTVLANGDKTVNECDRKCRAEYVCGFTNHRRSEFSSCLQTETNNAAFIGL